MTPCIYHLYMEMAKDYIPKKRIVEAKQKHWPSATKYEKTQVQLQCSSIGTLKVAIKVAAESMPSWFSRTGAPAVVSKRWTLVVAVCTLAVASRPQSQAASVRSKSMPKWLNQMVNHGLKRHPPRSMINFKVIVV
jgi:hypothetical protein